MADPPPNNRALCGVRLESGGPVEFVGANRLVVAPGQLVVIEGSDGDALARVVFAPHQLVSNEPRVGPRGQVKRLATAEDVAHLGSSRGPSNGVVAAGLPEAWAEWLVGPDEEPAVRVEIDEDNPTAGTVIERLFPEREST